MKLSGAVRFALAARAPDEVLDLEELTLGVASLGKPDLDFAAVSRELDRLAAEVADDVTPSSPPDRVATQLAAALGGRLGFKGHPGVFSSPGGSYLDEVLETRSGLPILLSVVWILLGRRLGVPVEGVGFPGHFIACIDAPGARVYVDPFHGGVVREARDLMDRLPSVPRGVKPSEAARRLLEPTPARPLVTRMLTNLKNLRIDQDDHEAALAVVDKILLIGGEQASEVRDRALLLLHLGRPTEAGRDLRRYLVIEPEAADRGVVEQLIARTEES